MYFEERERTDDSLVLLHAISTVKVQVHAAMSKRSKQEDSDAPAVAADTPKREIEYTRFIKTIKRFEVDSSGDIDYEEALEYFRRYQILHIRTFKSSDRGSGSGSKSFGPAQLQEMFEKFPNELKANYNVEVESKLGGRNVAIEQVFTKNREGQIEGSWYVSSILQAAKKGSKVAKEIENFVASKLPIVKPRLFDDIDVKQSAPVWLFIGQHIPDTSSSSGGQRCTNSPCVYELQGRKEHTDSISSSGTWHYQCCGNKVWHVRSFEDHRDWLGMPPVISSASSGGGIPSVKRLRSGSSSRVNKCDGISRIRITCKEGDLLFVNTRLWWHQTFLPRSDDSKYGLSISYARDFVAPSLSLERSSYYQTPIKSDADDDDDDDDDDDAHDDDDDDDDDSNNEDDDEDEDEDEDVKMANVEGIYASRNVPKGNIVLRQSELPDCSLPESYEYNCEVVEIDDGTLALVATEDIVAGDWLTVSFSDESSEDDDNDLFNNDEYIDLYGDKNDCEQDGDGLHNDEESDDDGIDALSVD